MRAAGDPAPARRTGDHVQQSRSGNCWDNSAMESFFKTLKTERTDRKVYRNRAEPKAEVFDAL
jgi:transposase InsO family protein